ncbi:MAG: hypothetical protein FWD99_10200 [Oscillospiraceae bacterium]|nr:hypothetical protein [Oscillospiraceae bacterium]
MSDRYRRDRYQCSAPGVAVRRQRHSRAVIAGVRPLRLRSGACTPDV